MLRKILDLGKEIIFFGIVCLFWNLFLFGMRLFLSSVIRMRSKFFLLCVVSFFIFPVWMKKVGNEKEKKILVFLVSQFWSNLELFCSRKTKNLLEDMEEKENELLIKRVLQVIFFSILKKWETRESESSNM